MSCCRRRFGIGEQVWCVWLEEEEEEEAGGGGGFVWDAMEIELS